MSDSKLKKARQYAIDHWVEVSGVLLNPTEVNEVFLRLLANFAEEAEKAAVERCLARLECGGKLKKAYPPLVMGALELIGFLRSCVACGESLSDVDNQRIDKWVKDWLADGAEQGKDVLR